MKLLLNIERIDKSVEDFTTTLEGVTCSIRIAQKKPYLKKNGRTSSSECMKDCLSLMTEKMPNRSGDGSDKSIQDFLGPDYGRLRTKWKPTQEICSANISLIYGIKSMDKH